MEEYIALAKTQIGALLDHKDNAIQELKKMLERKWVTTTEEEEKVH